MLTAWAKKRVDRLYQVWAGPDPHTRPQGPVFDALSTTWRASRALYRHWVRSQQPILVMIDGQPRLTGCGSITGWTLARSGQVNSVQAWVGNQMIAESVPNYRRADAHVAYPFYPHQQMAGFRLCPPAGLLPDGVHALKVRAIDSDGYQAEMETLLTVDRFTQADDPNIVPDFTGTNREYQFWLKKYDRHKLPVIHNGPLISVIMPIYRPRIDQLLEAIASVRGQTYHQWELCLCDDGSCSELLTQKLETLADGDPYIKLTTLPHNMGISAATNHAIEFASGDYLAFLDQDDRLHPQALQAVASRIKQTAADLYFTDEDRIDDRGRRQEPFFKPGWSPDLLHTMMYVGHLTIYRRTMLQRTGLCDSRFDGTQDWELALRVTDQPGCKVEHIPGIFYHWRQGGHSALEHNNHLCHERGKSAVEDSLQRQGKRYRVETGPRPCTFHVLPPARTPRVSILIPTKDQPRLLERCLTSIRQRTEYPDIEIIVIDNGSTTPRMMRYLDQCPADRVLRIDEPFNHSMLNNQAAEIATGEFLVLLNDDTEVLSANWLTSMVEQGLREDVGAVGAWLIYPDGRTQHAGIILEDAAVARHLSDATMLDGLDRGLSQLTRDVSAVTGACLLIRRCLYLSIGGLDAELLPTSYNDLDLCLRLRHQGYRIVLSPRAKLIHNESASRKMDARDEVYRQTIRDRWSDQLKQERFWSSHLGQSGDWYRGLALQWR
ncbi:MAG TPA: glycosyltransferase [Gemmatales bacterium]|nr:glycosyltransferase [Gemmatales bacterium]